MIGLSWIFASGRAELPSHHFWNRIFADTGFALLCLTLMIGPAARFLPIFNPLLPWRRELGIAFLVAAVLHVLIYADGIEWNLLKFFVDTEGHHHPVLLQNAYAVANWIGVVALLYGIILALTSNNFSQQLLGKGWKFLQQQSYTLFILLVLHTGVLLYLAMQSGYGVFRPVFWSLTILTITLQFAGYIQTIRQYKQSRHQDNNQS